jgi:hypothetical protein
VSAASGTVTLRLRLEHKHSNPRPSKVPLPFELDLYENFRLTHVEFRPIYGVGRLAGIKFAHFGRRWYVHVASAFLLPETTRLRLGKRPRQGFCLNGGSVMMYVQKQPKQAFFSNVTTILPLPGLVGGDMGAFARPRLPPLIGQWPQNTRKSKTAA